MADGHLVETEIKRICQISGLKSAVFQLILSSGEGGGRGHVDHLRVHQDHVLIFFVIFNLILICLCRNTISREQFQRSRFMETHNS